MTTRTSLRNRLRTLEAHLKTEHPGLVELMPLFRRVDRVLYRTGLLDRSESLAARIPWWPMISVLGTFSAGKSTFINSHLGVALQSTGNQAVDDKFTVICYGESSEYRVLPGTALNADPRFPFFRISDEIEKVAPGEGKRIDAYLQLKTVASPRTKGMIVIDSPGFDSDDQRRSTLRITDHIIDLSDLVLIFFDARHPEPGAMQDTLQHLVSKTVRRADPTKFLYVLNQIDTTAKEDNATEVVGAWQRAIAQAGLVSGRFYAIYNSSAAVEIDNPEQRARYEAKRDHDLREIEGRIDEIGVGRSYRVVAMLETAINELETELIPELRKHLARWRKRVMLADIGWGVVLAAALGGLATVLDPGVLDAGTTWLTGTEPGITEAAGAAPAGTAGTNGAAVAEAAAPPGASADAVATVADPLTRAWETVQTGATAAVAWLGAALGGIGQGTAAVAVRGVAVLLGLWLLFQIGHLAARAIFARRLAPQVPEVMGSANLRVREAFRRNTGFWTRVYRGRPVGWTHRALRRLQAIRETAMAEVQRLNDQYTDPSGRKVAPAPAGVPQPPLTGTSAFAPPPADPLAVPAADTGRGGGA
ncbi:dynamin family protein [Roseospira goensis]|uniref:Dynamin N-terminal domain-containing protein n=1 Tax=Roseospira goensis TaxID=391922 RepID=A0A7W6RZS1_9PROT|nr:dynamin family protein [Roseospira goensis]MBB4286102.1 hypothetical protein [Roseospira goensis]